MTMFLLRFATTVLPCIFCAAAIVMIGREMGWSQTTIWVACAACGAVIGVIVTCVAGHRE